MTVTTGQKTALELVGATTTRARVYDITVGNSGAPADNAGVFQVRRHTATGTGTAITAVAIDPGDPAAIITCKEDDSVEPTIGAAEPLLDIPLNMRATYRWVAAPDGELVMPASTNGLAFSGQNSGSVGPLHANAHWQE